MLNLKNIKLSFASKILLEDASVSLNKLQKVGLIGKNGAGKTSLFKVILNQLSLDSGEMLLNEDTLISYVEQEITDQDLSILEYVVQSHPLIIEEAVELPQYYQVRPNASKMLINLGFTEQDLNRALHEFSGGLQMRANLAKALLVPSDLLLLDEPTNHLDLETVLWLEDWIKLYSGLAIIISHDREFLDNTVNHILLLQDQKLTLYSGNYSTFENTRYLQLQQNAKLLEKNHKKIASMQVFVDRFKAKASKAKQAKSKLKMIEKLQVTTSLSRDINYSIKFFEPEYQVNKLLGLKNANIAYNTQNILINNINIDIYNNSKIGLLGRNGVGKTSFIKALLDESTLLSGERYLDPKIKIAYFAQHSIDILDNEDTVLSFFMKEHKSQLESKIRAYLGSYGFSGNDVFKKISQFSGGEKARLSIANMIYHRPNILFLDEPTNHLDIEMREELAIALEDFDGAIVIVSHDKFLLQTVVDEYYLIMDHKLELFTGDLDDYHKLLEKNNITNIQQKHSKQQHDQNKQQNSQKLSNSNLINKSNNSKQLLTLEKKINQVTEELTNIDAKLQAFYVKMQAIHDTNKVHSPEYNYQTLADIQNAIDKLLLKSQEYKSNLEGLELQWMSLSE